MIPDFSPPLFTQSGPTITLKTFSDLRDSLTKLNAWVGYATNWFQSQLLPPLNNSTAITGMAAPIRTSLRTQQSLEERVATLEREVAELKERLNGG